MENVFDSNDENYNLQFVIPTDKTKLFGPLGDNAKDFNQHPLTYNHHHDGFYPQSFT